MTNPTLTNPPHTDDCDSGEFELMCPECRDAADAARCRHCSGTGVYEDETISRACPYCDATGEARDQ
jgi:primosomal protein N'